MKITVIGTINKDLILPFRGAPIESFGGIYYTVSILSQLLEDTDEILPISFLGSDMYESIKAVFAKTPNVCTDGLIPIDQKNHKVILEYTTPQERREKALFNFPPLEWQHLQKGLDADFFLVNLITGWDISANAFQKLGKKFGDVLYLDLHFLVMGIDELGRRFPQRPENVQRWIEVPRFLQMNQREFGIVNEEDLSVVEFFEKKLKAHQIFLLTAGEKGARVIYKQKDYIRNQSVPAFMIPRLVDTTGCGDAFGAGFVAKYLQTGDILKAVEYGNLVAAANAMLPGTNEMSRLLEIMDHIRKIQSEQ